ncbi:hypothetical protein AVEN_19798-1 [Araneus ventricosus]|uniref:Uncharacterized protein n=1 Tax=Araneus ventricosus TaxID=182803 RepID=A0A4Y2HBZ9_ARAVE|nr:hypothetical protein AVEN_19798-1 [Araneus ventricosus]
MGSKLKKSCSTSESSLSPLCTSLKKHIAFVQDIKYRSNSSQKIYDHVTHPECPAKLTGRFWKLTNPRGQPKDKYVLGAICCCSCAATRRQISFFIFPVVEKI